MRNTSTPRPDTATAATAVGERVETGRKKKTKKKDYF